MKDTNEDQSAVMLSHRRENDGRVTVTAVVMPLGTKFEKPIFPQEATERAKFINDLCAEMPGIAGDKKRIRSELEKIARSTAIDLRFNTCGQINGRASCSARLWSGTKVIETSSLNLLSPDQRTKSIKHLAKYVAGNGASKKKIAAAEQSLKRLFMAELQRVLTAPAQNPPSTFDPDRPEKVPYEMIDGVGIIWLKPLPGGGEVPQRLTNFTGRIVAEVTRDDGSGDLPREFELEVETRSGKSKLILKNSEFQEMKWPMEKLGTRGNVLPGQNTREYARDAIIRLSGEPPEKHIHICPGWIKTQKHGWVYLHGGGAISSGDATPSVEVELDPSIANFVLPAPSEDPIALKASIKASLDILNLTKSEIVYPVYCCLGRAPLGWTDCVINLVGRTGTFKSEVASLIQRHFGSSMHAKNLPGSWESTINAIGEQQFLARDTLLVIDDFKLKGSPNDIMRQHSKADTSYRWQGNGVGKGRMNAAGGLRHPRPPRGTIISTSEHIPQGESCRGRGLHVPVSPGDIIGSELARRQHDAEEGLYACAMSGYIRWLAQDARIETIRKTMPDRIREFRAKAQSSELHKRTPEIVANLYFGLQLWLKYCVDMGAINETISQAIDEQAWAALGRVAQLQLEHQASSEPVSRYLELVTSALGSGKAHIASDDGTPPADEIAVSCGWWRRHATHAWEPRGACVGYINTDGVYLIPDAAYAAAQLAGGPGGSGLVEPENELRKRLEEKGALARTDGGKFNRRTVRLSFAGMMRPVLWLKPGVLPLSCARSVRSEPDPSEQIPIFDPEMGNR